MNAIFRALILLLAFGSRSRFASAQTAVRIDPAKGGLGWLTHPYQARYVPPVNLGNSSRFDSLIRAGNLYLSAQDVIALALENNIDIEVQRYGPLLAREVLRRAEAGSLLRNVGQGVVAGPTSVSLSGVSVNTNGAPASGGGSGVSAGGGIVTQLGPAIPSFDPNHPRICEFSARHFTAEPDVARRNQRVDYERPDLHAPVFAELVDGPLRHAHLRQHLQQGQQHLDYSLNPFTNGDLDLVVTQNLLNGFGRAVNGRNIRVQKNNMKATDLQFKQQVITTVTAALNLYWDLVSFDQDLKAREQEVATAQQLLQNNQEQVRIGTLAEIEVTRAQSQLYAAQAGSGDLANQSSAAGNDSEKCSQPDRRCHFRPGRRARDPARYIHAFLPKTSLPPVNDLVADALKNRVEVQQANINLESNKLNLVGIKNSLKPTLQVFAELTNNGLERTQAMCRVSSGGYGTLLAQIFRRDYPNYSAGLSLNIPLRNRAAQSDYATSLIGIRQNELNLQKQINQVRVDVQNAVIGLQQARVRYDAAVEARKLSQQTFDADKKKYELGAGTPYQVVQDQRDLASAQSSEAQAMANYSHARIAFDQALGRTLEVNHISMDEAISGRVSAMSSTAALATPQAANQSQGANQ